jgi:hypothetical protein
MIDVIVLPGELQARGLLPYARAFVYLPVCFVI